MVKDCEHLLGPSTGCIHKPWWKSAEQQILRGLEYVLVLCKICAPAAPQHAKAQTILAAKDMAMAPHPQLFD